MIEPLLCSFCLASKDARVEFTAEMKNGETIRGPATGAAKLIAWSESVDPVGLKYFEYAATRHVLLPIAVFEGTPVCEPHLWDVTDRYWRRRV